MPNQGQTIHGFHECGRVVTLLHVLESHREVVAGRADREGPTRSRTLHVHGFRSVQRRDEAGAASGALSLEASRTPAGRIRSRGSGPPGSLRDNRSRHVLGREHAAGQQQQHDAEGLRHCSYYWHAMHGVTHFDGPYIASSALHFLSSFPKDLKQISDCVLNFPHFVVGSAFRARSGSSVASHLIHLRSSTKMA
jgi:hypothetical protein